MAPAIDGLALPGAPGQPGPGANQPAAAAKAAQAAQDAAQGKPAADVQPPLAAEPIKKAADLTEFQRFVHANTGQWLPLWGYDLFARANAYAPVQSAPMPVGYVLGPGDEIVLQLNGAVDFTERFVLDREGRILVPKVGPLGLAGVALADAEKVISQHLSKVYRNFNLNVSMGRLRSIEVFVVGQASAPGKHYVSSLSNLINALFETGGPTSNGSLRAVELRRGGKTVAQVDLYSFLAHGDNQADVKLLPGDILVIPPAGPRAAVLGTVNAPAIYELKAGETIRDVLALTGGLPTLAAPQKAQLERVQPQNDVARYVQDFALDAQGLATPLQAGDVLTVFQISPQIANVVTLLGNVASPLRYTYRDGMKVSDLLNDKRLVIPAAYWLGVNAGQRVGNYSRPEVNLDYATLQRLDPLSLRTRTIAFNLAKAMAKDPAEDLTLVSGDIITVYAPGDAGVETDNSVSIAGEPLGGLHRFVWRPGFKVRDIIPNGQWLIDYYNYWQRPSANSLKNDINWSYAQVIRRVPATLSTRALTFHLGNAVLKDSPTDNLELQPGDQITLYTTQQVAVPLAQRNMVVRLEGEVAVPGSYQLQPGETLPQLIRRAGGLTPQAYLFGTELRRDSVRAHQQANLDAAIRRLEDQARNQNANLVANRGFTSSGADATQVMSILQTQNQTLQAQIDRLRSLKSNGRLALELDPMARNLAHLPNLPLEDGDQIVVPSTPGFVAAVGTVNNENVFIYKPGKTAEDVLATAGPSQDADLTQTFVLRADGTVVAPTQGWFSRSVTALELMPGDTVVVPALQDRETRYSAFMRGLKDWTSILANFGISAAAFKSLGY